MTTENLTSKQAAEIFLRKLINRAYDGAIDTVTVTLQKGSPGRKRQEDKLALQQWFQSLDKQGQDKVLAIVRETSFAAVFGCLVLLDNVTGGYPIEGKISDFALYLQAYADDKTLKIDSPQTAVRINQPYKAEDDLHDMFQFILQERTKHEK